MKVAVIGLGGTGSAALRFLAQDGHEVTGFEQFRVGHTRGSSHGESRIIRYTYPSALYTNLMAHAYPLWADLEERAQEELFVRCGGLYIGEKDGVTLQNVASALDSAERPYDLLDPEAAERRFPVFRLADGESALFQSDSGFLRSSACVAANVRLAAAAGATIREETPIAALRASGAGVALETANGVELFDRALVTAGPWMSQILRQHAHLPVQVTRRQVMYLHIARNPERFQPGTMPVWIDSPASTYGFPADGRIAGVKLAYHTFEGAFDPNNPERPIDDDETARLIAYAQRRFPDISSEVSFSVACLYTVAPNEDFLIDAVPDVPGAHFVSGCSGHGFKFTVLLGRIAADLAEGQAGKWDLTPFRLADTHIPDAGEQHWTVSL